MGSKGGSVPPFLDFCSMDPTIPTHSKSHRLKTPVRLEFIGSGKTGIERMLEYMPQAVFPAIRNYGQAGGAPIIPYERVIHLS